MTPAGYMAKRVVPRPDWINAPKVDDVYSVSGCVSEYFADYIKYWRHNGYWFFDSPDIIKSLAHEHAIDLRDCRFFYYEVFEEEFNGEKEIWEPFKPDDGSRGVKTNRHCLFASFEEAKSHIEGHDFDNSEPGPFRVFAVYSVGEA